VVFTDGKKVMIQDDMGKKDFDGNARFMQISVNYCENEKLDLVYDKEHFKKTFLSKFEKYPEQQQNFINNMYTKCQIKMHATYFYKNSSGKTVEVCWSPVKIVFCGKTLFKIVNN
jgi:hypothetical protein